MDAARMRRSKEGVPAPPHQSELNEAERRNRIWNLERDRYSESRIPRHWLENDKIIVHENWLGKAEPEGEKRGKDASEPVA